MGYRSEAVKLYVCKRIPVPCHLRHAQRELESLVSILRLALLARNVNERDSHN